MYQRNIKPIYMLSFCKFSILLCFIWYDCSIKVVDFGVQQRILKTIYLEVYNIFRIYGLLCEIFIWDENMLCPALVFYPYNVAAEVKIIYVIFHVFFGESTFYWALGKGLPNAQSDGVFA
ncbi:hypothetical protein ACJX0J_030482, partial [Zea mays]